MPVLRLDVKACRVLALLPTKSLALLQGASPLGGPGRSADLSPAKPSPETPQHVDQVVQASEKVLYNKSTCIAHHVSSVMGIWLR